MKKFLVRFLSALLSVVMLACMLPVLVVSAADEELQPPKKSDSLETWTKYYCQQMTYETAKDRLDAMELFYETAEYALYCDPVTAVVAYQKKATDEILFTNPWDLSQKETALPAQYDEMMSQIIVSYKSAAEPSGNTLNSFSSAVMKNQINVLPIRNGVRVEYSIGELSSRYLLPMRIEEQSFITYIKTPLEQAVKDKKITSDELSRFMVYFAKKEQGGPGVAEGYPVTEKKNINLYVYNDSNKSPALLRRLESYILQYCPEYSFAQMEADYELVEYEEDSISPPVFRMALEYTISDAGLSVSLPANGLRYDETLYRITNLQILPYMGASYKGSENKDAEGNPVDGGLTYDGYSFLPDGSGALYSLSTLNPTTMTLYGADYAAISGLSGKATTPMRMPVFGQATTVKDAKGETVEQYGYFAIIEQGDAMASLTLNHTEKYYTSVIPSFITRPMDHSKSGWDVYASRRYTDDYRIRYIILSDENKAEQADLSRYYECSWLGMACAYRDYLSATQEGFERLTKDDVQESIPLYIETFGCTDTVKKIMSVPVTVSVALTSFEDIETMYEYLLGEKISNVQFKMTGYANGGLYSEVPYKLKWEKAAGGKAGFEALVEYAVEHPEMGLFPDFDFLYTKNSESSVNMKKYGARTVDNRYTTKRTYSVTRQDFVSYFEMVRSPATFSHFYEKLEKRYAKYGNLSISLSTMGSDLNSSYDEEDVSLREDSKNYTIEALNYFSEKNYDIMVDGGNAYTWAYADYILDVPLDSNRYIRELSAVPFVGVVLHGYVQFAGSPLNMEGNLTYAMLKAMESGAGVYFILSYANTELLKEDELLSQNYSVRYDIWRARLVEIYNELNEVLHDVQDRLIIDHEFLNRDDATNTSRVPDEEELWQDALAEAERQAAALQEKIEKTKAAEAFMAQAEAKMQAYADAFDVQYALVQAQRSKNSALMSAWNAYLADKSNKELEKAFNLALTTYVARPVAELTAINKNIDTLLEQTKAQYDYLRNTGADLAICEAAKVELSKVIDIYVAIRARYIGVQTVTLTAANKDVFINSVDKVLATDLALEYGAPEAVNEVLSGYTNIAYDRVADREAFLYRIAYREYGDNEQYVDIRYDNVAVETLLTLFMYTLNTDGINVKLEETINALTATLVLPKADTTVEAEESNNYKYVVDSDVVKVTYGDYDENGDAYAVKSLILNFNDYAITTTVEVNGELIVYNIEAYGYAVITYPTK
ncbi:MAG: hypothetical protein IJC99_07195 [Clostridia bacterium]|nr:hypothetical protein [Clostridia bacterium]